MLLALGLVFSVLIVDGADASSESLPSGVKSLEAPGLHNLFVVGNNLYSGSSPEGDEGFESLVKLGIKTIITVDGGKPDVEAAHKHGMRYVHLPHGYDGISTNLQLQLAKAGEALPGPIYVHCHHGMHRGPAAVAVICMATEGWSAAQADAWLRKAGTATNYIGLYKVVDTFQKPSAQQLAAVSTSFPEVARVSGLVEAMVAIDESWEHLKAVRKAGYQAPKEHPDLQPANEAVILWEHYREAQRLSDSIRHGTDFIARLKAAEDQAKEMERLLNSHSVKATPEIRADLDKAFGAMGRSCAACHKAFRD